MYHHVPLYSIPNFSTQFRCFGHSQGNFRCFIADLWPLRWEHLCRCLVYCRIWTRMRSQGSVRVRAMALRSDVLMKFREASLLITSLVAWKGNRSFSLAKESPFLPSLLADRFGWRHWELRMQQYDTFGSSVLLLLLSLLEECLELSWKFRLIPHIRVLSI